MRFYLRVFRFKQVYFVRLVAVGLIEFVYSAVKIVDTRFGLRTVCFFRFGGFGALCSVGGRILRGAGGYRIRSVEVDGRSVVDERIVFGFKRRDARV